jgi:hypothetical protein
MAIQEIRPRDCVLNKNGKEQKVLKTYKRSYAGDLIEIKAEGILPILLTPEHRVLVTKRKWKEKSKRDRKYEYSQNLEFIEAENLNKNCALVFPKLKENKKWNQPFNLSPELMRFLGLFLAEGYTITAPRRRKGKIIGNHGVIRFCFGKHEKKLVNQVCEIIKKVFNKKALIVETKTTVDVMFYSIKIAKWLSEKFGKKAPEKKIPSFIMELEDEELIKEFIKAFIDGDGYINSKYIQLTTSSEGLALQLQKLLSKLDLFGRLYVNKRAGASKIGGRNVEINDLYNIRITAPDFHKFLSTKNNSKRNRRLYAKTKDYFFLPVRNISKKRYSGTVHNLETKDKTFELNNVVVHNCEHTYWKEPSINMSFQQFKKIFDSFGRPKWLGLTGIGSSYLNPDYHKMLKYAKSKGTIVEVFDHFAHFKNDEQIKELIEIGPDFQFMSTYGATKKSFEKVCVGSDFNKVVRNLKKFVELKKKMKKRFPILSFHYIITSESKGELLEFLDFVHSLNTEIGEILVTPMLHSFKEAEKFTATINKEYVEKIEKKALKLGIPITINWSAQKQVTGAETKPPISKCKEYIMPFIFVTGHVTPCCGQNEANQREWQKAESLGNALEKPFRKIWYSPRYKKMRKMIRNNKCPSECKFCPAYRKNS